METETLRTSSTNHVMLTLIFLWSPFPCNIYTAQTQPKEIKSFSLFNLNYLQKTKRNQETASSTSYHTRSNSLPNRSNPLVSQFDEQLNRLKSSESASCSSSSIDSKLTLINDLYVCIDGFLQLPSSQKDLCQNQKSTEDALEGSIKLLDICSSITDALVQMKEQAQKLQSILRRRCSKDEITKEASEYLKSRKIAIKALSKALKDSKKSNEITNEVSRLGECQTATLSVLESVLVSMVGPNQSTFSKLLKSKRASNQSFLIAFEATDAIMNPEQARIQMEKMVMCINDVEQGVESLFRHLIKTRTTILNILSC